jgi:predicted PurR-regulated permease PerM
MTQAQLIPAAVLPRWLLVLMGTAAATITIAGLMGAADLIGPVFLALVLTIAVHPLRRWLQGHHLPGWLATLVMALTVYAFLFAFGLALVLATAEFASLLPTYKDQMESAVQDATAWLANFGVNQAELDKISSSFDVGKLADAVGDILGGLLGLLSDLFFIVTLLLFYPPSSA